MTHARIRAVLKNIRYKPGWTIRLDHAGDIEITADVMDAYHPSRKPIDRPHAYVVNPHTSASTRVLLARIFDACQRLEFHECGEWFRYRGTRSFLSGH
jgi:hypothetical protein